MKSESIAPKTVNQQTRKSAGEQGKADSNQVVKLHKLLDKKKSKLAPLDAVDSEAESIDMQGKGAAPTGPGIAGFSAGGMSDLLNQAIRGLPGQGGSQSESAENATPDAALVLQGAGEFGQRPGPVMTEPVAGVERPAEPEVENLVERILVSVPQADGANEVRIKIDPKTLPGTEIAIASRPGEALSVEFMSDNVDSQRFLLPNLGALRERLEDRIGGDVSVRMSENASSDTGDGRSRNRRNLYEEIGDDRTK